MLVTPPTPPTLLTREEGVAETGRLMVLVILFVVAIVVLLGGLTLLDVVVLGEEALKDERLVAMGNLFLLIHLFSFDPCL